MASKGNKTKKCDGCIELKSDVVLCADDMLSRSCQVANERALNHLALDRRVSVWNSASAAAIGEWAKQHDSLALSSAQWTVFAANQPHLLC